MTTQSDGHRRTRQLIPGQLTRQIHLLTEELHRRFIPPGSERSDQ
jgi:hypothetical protein